MIIIFWILTSRCSRLDWQLLLLQKFIQFQLCCFIKMEEKMLELPIFCSAFLCLYQYRTAWSLDWRHWWLPPASGGSLGGSITRCHKGFQGIKHVNDTMGSDIPPRWRIPLGQRSWSRWIPIYTDIIIQLRNASRLGPFLTYAWRRSGGQDWGCQGYGGSRVE